MSTQIALNTELIMRQIAERHPSHAQSTSSLTTSARAVALSTVDREIDAAILAAILLARTLLTRRNTLVPVSVLPPEVLSRIFHLVAPAKWSWKEVGSVSWISVAQVCRHWRQVALDDSSLWARILGYPSTARLSEMLARARNAPLVIDFPRKPKSGTLAMLPAHVAHTREFRLRTNLGVSLIDDGVVEEICSLEAPAMEHFELRSTCSIARLKAPFFNGVAPKLRTFSLSQFCVPWSFIPCGQLTQLEITLSRMSVADGPSLDDSKSLIDLLINSPKLEILVLESCLPPGITRPSHLQAIHLPRLSYLSLGGPSSRVTNLLKILKLPPSTTLHMRCTSENTATHNDHYLLPLVSAHFHDPGSVEMKYFGVTFDPMDYFNIRFTAYTHLPISDVNGVAALALSFKAPPEVGVDIIGRVCSMLPISNIEFLSISDASMDQSINWGELFQRCAKVTTIEATGWGTPGLLKGLTPPKPKKAPSDGKGRTKKLDNRGVPEPASSSNAATADTPVPIFPKLTSLFLKNLGEPRRRPEALYDALSTTLRWRRACKVPLRVLRIEDGLITTDCANALEKLVPEFLCNGHKGASLDEFDDLGDLSDVSTEDL